ncbi:uncharacterized protein BT62DRAFT_925347 [Guyanagaster necrorhizus]|uniref:Uncharacterized protein n=1 Tax=Guyanagaster necrorhizus TaxID=856835 RepID=A0A9P7W3M6_9AGAR|nr:uncharacterized protein BT62DRAFT_925347 [Guyanagaster necrorhizus MCA 3950]KAG7452806.1 hypothetical protein BT62DRAFT_925347 [Guyanagaster necrorhizus MCA 3950]
MSKSPPPLEAFFIALQVEILLYGMYTCLFASSLYLLIFKRQKTKVVKIMIALNTIMWSLATSHLAVSFSQNYQAIFREHGVEDPTAFEDSASPWICTQLSLENMNFVLGDGVVIWRAWVLWNRKRWILFASVIFLLVTLGAGIGVTFAFATAPKSVSVFENPSLHIWELMFILSTMATNVWATSLIAYRAWSHNKVIRTITGEAIMARFRRQNGILALLIESGIFYSCTWLIAIIVTLCGNKGAYIVIYMLSQLTAIYPTLIIALVGLRSTLDVAIETFQDTQYGQRGAGTDYHIGTVPVKIEIQQTTYTSHHEDLETGVLVIDAKSNDLIPRP